MEYIQTLDIIETCNLLLVSSVGKTKEKSIMHLCYISFAEISMWSQSRNVRYESLKMFAVSREKSESKKSIYRKTILLCEAVTT